LLFLPGNGFTLHGHNIKIDGSDPSCGVYFVPVMAPSEGKSGLNPGKQPLKDNGHRPQVRVPGQQDPNHHPVYKRRQQPQSPKDHIISSFKIEEA
jgi:hypothetical protein